MVVRNMVEKVRSDLLLAVKERLAAKGVSTDSDFAEFPVGGVCEQSVPFIGTMHIPAGRVIKRADSERRFRLMKA